jgi:hypothetical protein
MVVDTVFDEIDKDKDGKITLSEFEAVGLDALPSFEELGVEGHHYDVESGAYQLRNPSVPLLIDFQQSFSSIMKVRMI